MARAQLHGVPSNIALINGPFLLGNLFGYGLFGILVVQVFIYHTKCRNDPTWIKCLVWGVFFVDTLITALGTVTVWDNLASGWGDLRTLSWLDWPYNVLPALSSLVSTTVHFFFCWRIWKLSGSFILPALIVCISLVQWAMATYCGIVSVRIGVARIGELRSFVIVWLGGSALVDTLITIIMLSILFRAKSRSAFRQTNSTVQKLIKLTVETGMTTAVAAVVELIFFFGFPTNNMHFIPFYMLAKLYSNTLLATLNSRLLFSQSGKTAAALWDDVVSSENSDSTRPNHVPVIHITTITERHRSTMNMFSNQGSIAEYYSTRTSTQDRSVGTRSREYDHRGSCRETV